MKLCISGNHRIFLLLFGIFLLLFSCESKDEGMIPSPENDFLGKDYFSYMFDGKREYEYADRMYVDVREYLEPSTTYNLISGPSRRRGFGEFGLGETEDFFTSYFFWLPVKEHQIQDLIIPYRSETTRSIGFPNATTDST